MDCVSGLSWTRVSTLDVDLDVDMYSIRQEHVYHSLPNTFHTRRHAQTQENSGLQLLSKELDLGDKRHETSTRQHG